MHAICLDPSDEITESILIDGSFALFAIQSSSDECEFQYECDDEINKKWSKRERKIEREMKLRQHQMEYVVIIPTVTVRIIWLKTFLSR